MNLKKAGYLMLKRNRDINLYGGLKESDVRPLSRLEGSKKTIGAGIMGDGPRINILTDDLPDYMIDSGKCSRCGSALKEDEVPLRIWDAQDPNLMWSFCEDCSQSVFK